MSDTSSGNAKIPMEHPDDELSKAMENLSVTAGDSDETSTPKNLSDMPLDVVELIVARSDYKEQLVLRKVSKSLRSLVDQQKPSCTSLHLTLQICRVLFEFNKKKVYYAPKGCRSYDWFLARSEKYGWIKLIESDDFEKIAYADLAYTLKNPKLQLESISFQFENNSSIFYRTLRDKYKNVRNVLESINHQISTKKFEIYMCDPDDDFSILPYLKPGVLETIEVYYYSTGLSSYMIYLSLEKIKQISELDQWKQAEGLTLKYGFKYFPWKYANHFKRFHFYQASIDSNDLQAIVSRLLTLENFEYCTITTDCEFRDSFLHIELGEPAPSNDRTEYVSHYSIPDSNDYLEFLFFEKTIEIRKMKRSNSTF